jgi:hypothetical protein
LHPGHIAPAPRDHRITGRIIARFIVRSINQDHFRITLFQAVLLRFTGFISYQVHTISGRIILSWPLAHLHSFTLFQAGSLHTWTPGHTRPDHCRITVFQADLLRFAGKSVNQVHTISGRIISSRPLAHLHSFTLFQAGSFHPGHIAPAPRDHIISGRFIEVYRIYQLPGTHHFRQDHFILDTLPGYFITALLLQGFQGTLILTFLRS